MKDVIACKRETIYGDDLTWRHILLTDATARLTLMGVP